MSPKRRLPGTTTARATAISANSTAVAPLALAMRAEGETLSTEQPSVSCALSVAAFCVAYSIGRTLAYEEIAAGRLRAKKVGSRTLILQSDAQAWADSLPALLAITAPKAQRGGAD